MISTKHTKQKRDAHDALRYNYIVLFFLCLVYILLLYTASFFRALYFVIPMQLLAIIVPLLLARYVSHFRMAAVDVEIGISPRPLLSTLWLLPPFVGTIYAMSLLSGKLATMAGIDTTYDFGTHVWVTVLVSAVIPAVTEELFCRYIFLPRLSPFSRSGAIFASALFFSFLHGNLYQIPYALVAGILLGALAVGCGSVLPCILFHFVNNLISILLHFYADTLLPTVLLYVLIGGIFVAALCAVFMRRRLWERLRLAFFCDRTTGAVVAALFTTPIVVFLIIFLINAILPRFLS